MTLFKSLRLVLVEQKTNEHTFNETIKLIANSFGRQNQTDAP